ncbi:oxygenase MpaB family protein [Jatrophihabitans sp.]|uniref:oxygenase MpaB family protein n=1 Tax=Jatrophihabitans sp. TaxID=1932789 RepID=UPI0030C680C1|nr:uncharacterized protein [Jatrophihabitans sp.]
MTDVGYFGPQSVTWRIHSEPVSLVGGLRALLLQALHPGAMRLLDATSNFRDDPWVRLEHTALYVGVLTFGTTADVDAAARRVRTVHQQLGITDSEQLAWVHVCLVDSFLAATRAGGLRLNQRERDQFVAEQLIAAELVGAPAALVPRTQAELREFIREIRPRLAGTREAREAARYVIAPPRPPVPRRFVLPARVGWTTISSLAVGLLPGWARRMYLLPPLPGASLTTSAGMRALRQAVRVLPEQYREGPLYREAKARVAALG